MLDTNVIISAVLNPTGHASAAMTKALQAPFEPCVCEYILDELMRKFEEKFPHRINELNMFLSSILTDVEVIKTPNKILHTEAQLRDIKDRPILRAALESGVDVLLTGDKDFLDLEPKPLKILSPSDFMRIYDFT